MSLSTNMRHGRRFSVGIAIALLAGLIPLATAFAAASVTPATGGSAIPSDQAGSVVYTPLTGPVITEGGTAVFSNGTVVLNVAPGFVFKAAAGTVAKSGAGCNLTATALVVTTTTATFTIGGAPSTATTCVFTYSGLMVQPANLGPLASGNMFENGTATGVPTGATNYGTLTEVASTPLSFAIQPSPTATGGTPFTIQPTVHDQDAGGSPRLGDPITLSITPGTGTAGAVLTCTTNPVNTNALGNATFVGCRIDKPGVGYQLRASTPGATPADSTAITVTAGPADHLVFTSYPATSTPALFNPQPTVAVVDAGGNTPTGDVPRLITLTINQNAGTFTCTSGPTRTTSASTASFTGCTETVVANGYFLTASTPGLTSAIGPNFNVTSGPASMVVVCWGATLPCNTTPPSPIVAATPFSTQPVVRIEDAAGNTVVTDSTSTVTLGILAGTPASGGPGTLTCTGGNTVTVVNGVGTFTGCRIDKTGTGYRLSATSSPALTAGSSTVFNVVNGASTTLAFLTQPATTPAGVAFNPNLQVAIEDAGGNVVTSGISATVTLAIGVNPNNGVLTCTGGTSAVTVAGVATFTGCSINNPGVGYTLVASASNVTPAAALGNAQTNAFTIASAPASITISASSSVITWGGSVLLTVQFGSNGSGRAVTIQVSKDNATWSNIASLTTNSSGTASFSYRPSDNRYYRATFAGAADLSPGNSASVRVVVRQINILRPAPTSLPRTISHGTQVTFTSTVRPNRPELPQAHVEFRVYQLKGSTWTQVLSQTVGVNSGGVATLKVTFVSIGKFYVRSQAVPTTFNANSGWSAIVRYDVQ